MTSITKTLGIGKCRTDRVGRRFGARDLASGENLLDVGDDPLQQARLSKYIPTGQADSTLGVRRVARRLYGVRPDGACGGIVR